MTVEEAAVKLNRTKWAIYKAIKRKSGIGKHFVYKAGEGYIIDGRKIKEAK